LINIARLVLDAGAHGITVHPRPDERHIRRSDVENLSTLLRTEYPLAEFNIEGYPSPEFLELVSDARPTQITLVPDLPDQSTSDHGWDIDSNVDFLQAEIVKYHNVGSRVALFVDPNPRNADLALHVGADRIELYTGPYGAAQNDQDIQKELEFLASTAERASMLQKLKVNAGHDLTVENLKTLTDRVHNIAEVSIGHGITAEALVRGFSAAVRRYLNVLIV
jgi:pyridoxine 5-phosphate synthase